MRLSCSELCSACDITGEPSAIRAAQSYLTARRRRNVAGILLDFSRAGRAGQRSSVTIVCDEVECLGGIVRSGSWLTHDISLRNSGHLEYGRGTPLVRAGLSMLKTNRSRPESVVAGQQISVKSGLKRPQAGVHGSSSAILPDRSRARCSPRSRRRPSRACPRP